MVVCERMKGDTDNLQLNWLKMGKMLENKTEINSE